MAYIAPTTRTTGDLVTAAIWNADIVANEIAINAGAIALTSQAIGDLIIASTTSQLSRVADVAVGQVLVSGGVGVAPSYSASPTLTGNPSLATGSAGFVAIGGGATASELRLLEPSASGSNYTAFLSPAMAGNVSYTLPTADGTSGFALTTNGSGTLSWAAAGAGDSDQIVIGVQVFS